MLKQTASLPVKLLLVGSALALASYLVYSYLNSGRAEQQNTGAEVAPPAVRGGSSANGALSPSASRPPVSAAQTITPPQAVNLTTYRPGVSRAQRQVPGTFNELMQNKSWWLYARSAKEAQWLDQYGFPTPEEHDKLMAASDLELAQLVKDGDVNAKAHLLTRETKKVIANGDPKEMDKLQGKFSVALLEAGPYQAIAMVRGFAEVAQVFKELPPEAQTEERRKIIQGLENNRQRAALLGIAYGDESAMASSRECCAFTWIKRLNLSAGGDVRADSSMMTLAQQARYRERNGLPPLIISARPMQDPDNPTLIVERY
jgi:hypothetical protein